MTDIDQETSEELRRALEHLRAGNLHTARPILVRLLKTHPDLEQGWYMLSFTVSDKRKQIYALEQVLRVNPNNEKARDRYQKISGEEPIPEAPIEKGPDLLSQRMRVLDVSDEDEEIDEPAGDQSEQSIKIEQEDPKPAPSIPFTTPPEEIETFRDDEKTKPDRKRLIRIALFALVAVVVILIIYFGSGILFSGSGEPVDEPTSTQSASPTEEATNTSGRQLPATWTPTVTPPPTVTETPTRTLTPTFVFPTSDGNTDS